MELFLVQNNSHKVYTLLNWEEYGLRITIPHEAVPLYDAVEVAITALVGGEFILPEDTELVSAVYTISVSKPLLKPVQLEIQHCVSIEKPADSNYLSFATAPSDEVSCEFQPVKGAGEFSVRSRYGSIYITEFSRWSIIMKKVGHRVRGFFQSSTPPRTDPPPSTLSPPPDQPSPSPSVATDESTIPPPQHQPSPSPSAATDDSTIPPLQHQPSPSPSVATDESTLVLTMCQQPPPSSESSPSITSTVSSTTTASYNTAPTDLEGMYRHYTFSYLL